MQFILEDFDGVYEDLYSELEKLNETRRGHELVLTAENAEDASQILCDKLRPFFEDYFEEYIEEDDEGWDEEDWDTE
jgi:hypothetical protein